MILDLCHPNRWVDGDGNAAGEQNTVKAEEITLPGGQHDGDRFPELQATLLQANRYRLRTRSELAIGDDVPLVLIGIELNVGPVRVGLHMPLQHIDQCLRAVRGRFRLTEIQLAASGGPGRHASRMGTEQAAEQVARGFRIGESTFGQADAEFTLNTDKEFHARQTVQAQIPVERAVQRYRRAWCMVGMDLGGELTGETQQPHGHVVRFVCNIAQPRLLCHHFTSLCFGSLPKSALFGKPPGTLERPADKSAGSGFARKPRRGEPQGSGACPRLAPRIEH